MDGGKESITLEGGRCLSPRQSMKVLGVAVDNKGSSSSAIAARVMAATGVWFWH